MFFKLYTIDYGKGTHKPKAQTARAYPGFFTTKYKSEYCYWHLYGILVHYSGLSPTSMSPVHNLYTWGKRDKVE